MPQHLLHQQPQQREGNEFEAAQSSSGEGDGTPSTISTGVDEEENAQARPQRSPIQAPEEVHPSHWGVGEVVAWLKKVRARRSGGRRKEEGGRRKEEIYYISNLRTRLFAPFSLSPLRSSPSGTNPILRPVVASLLPRSSCSSRPSALLILYLP
jgi:hypothetical protein